MQKEEAAVEIAKLTEDDEKAALSLRAELATRITTQSLHYRSGDEETAAKSVFRLFDVVRKLMVTYPEAISFGIIGTFLLNRILRPDTARWHRVIQNGGFNNELIRRQFRVELQKLQRRLGPFLDVLNLLAEGSDSRQIVAAFQKLQSLTPAIDRLPFLGGPVLAGITRQVAFASLDLPENLTTADARPPRFEGATDINKAEHEFIVRRRTALGLKVDPPKGREGSLFDATGLCLSGGGIRSATFCLGILQVLHRQGLLKQFDYLSTVSGGGYLGTFLTAFLGKSKDSGISPGKEFSREVIEEAFNSAFGAVDGHEADAVRHLRNNSRYLLNGGFWGRLSVVGLLLSGILTNIFLMLPIPLVAVFLVLAFQGAGFWGGQEILSADYATSSRWFAFWAFAAASIALSISWLALPIVRNMAKEVPPEDRRRPLRDYVQVGALASGLAVLGAGLLLALPWIFQSAVKFPSEVISWLPFLRSLEGSESIVAGVTALAPLVFGLLAARLKAGTGKILATILFTLSGPFLYCMVFLTAGIYVLSGHWLWVAVMTTAITLWGWLCVDVNDFSPHTFYRNRLCDCYLAARNADRTGAVSQFFGSVVHGKGESNVPGAPRLGRLRQLPLSEINETGAAPYHLLHTAANLPASRDPNLRGRDCDFYMFSKFHCGGPVCGYMRTETLEKLDRHVDLGTAMAISGAAASTNMGVQTMRQYRFWLALLNVRLGYWLRNPIFERNGFLNRPGPIYLLSEMIGWMHEKSRYLNLSDGGHIENLALYEMLRRRCKFIVVVDGGMEPNMECTDLMLVQRYAEIDLGIQFDINLADLALDSRRNTRAYAAFGKIHYTPPIDGDSTDLGWIVYLKLAFTGDEPGYVEDYRRRYPDFPHQPTSDQIYDEAQFEAYRRLGECAAESLFSEEILENFRKAGGNVQSQEGGPPFGDIAEWFKGLATSLLPDNDISFELKNTVPD